LIFQKFTNLLNLSFQKGEYPTEWKRANVSPIYKKDDHQYKENYRPISLLPSISKISEKIVFARLYEFLLEIHFFSDFQSGFRPGDSTVNQLTYIVHIIYQALDMGKEVRMVFLDFTRDFTKAFDKVWHKGLLYKLQTLGLKDPLLSWFRSYLTDRKQRVVIDGQTSNWLNTEAGVPQGSVLGPLLFLI
jgi:retron-type reverse transcriptase